MNVNRNRAFKRTQRRFSVYQQQTPKSTEQQQENLKQEQQQMSQEQEKEVEQEQTEQEQEQDLDLEQDQEEEQTEDPQLIREPSQSAKKVSKHTQTRKKQDFWYWVPRQTDDSQWECLVKGKGQEILETVFTSSKTTSHYEKFSHRQRGTTKTPEGAQHKTQGKTTQTQTQTQPQPQPQPQPHASCSNPSHEARPSGQQYRYPTAGTSAGCSNYAPGMRNFPHWGMPCGRMPAPQMYPPGMQPPRTMAMDPTMYPPFGLSAPVQNPMTPEQLKQPRNARTSSSVETSVNQILATLREIIAGIIVLCEQHPELTSEQIRGKITEMFQQMFGESGNREQQ